MAKNVRSSLRLNKEARKIFACIVPDSSVTPDSIRYRYIQRYDAHMSKKDFDKIILHLLDQGLIHWINEKICRK